MDAQPARHALRSRMDHEHGRMAHANAVPGRAAGRCFLHQPLVSAAPWCTMPGRAPLTTPPSPLRSCLFSNKLTMESAGRGAAQANQVHVQQCVRMAYNETLTVDVVFTNNPNEGISVLYDASTSGPGMLPNYGVLARSEARVRPPLLPQQAAASRGKPRRCSRWGADAIVMFLFLLLCLC